MKTSLLIYLLVVVVALGFLPGMASADSGTNHFAKLATNSLTPLLLAGGLSLSLGGNVDRLEERQASKAMLMTGLATEVLKLAVREKRPDSNSRSSFPSGHTSAAFAMATVLSSYKPKLTLPAYAVAGAVGWSRVELHQHYWHDVAAGAALGYLIGKHYTKKSHLTVSPAGVGLNWKF